jgi:hypothetical protein
MDLDKLNESLAKETPHAHEWKAISVDTESLTYEVRCDKCGVTQRRPLRKE